MKILCIVLLVLLSIVFVICLYALYMSVANQWITGKPSWRWKLLAFTALISCGIAGSILGLIFLP